MRYILFALTLFITFAPLTSHAAFGFVQIVPEDCKCEKVSVEGAPAGTPDVPSAPAWGCVLQTIQNVIRVAIALGFVLVTLAFVYAGFVWMTSGGSPERRSQGKTLLLNALIGLATMLGAWLIVDFLMKELYREPTEFGPWNNILAGNGPSANNCIIARQPVPITTVSVGLDLTSGSGVSTSGSMTDQQAREALSSGGVEIYNWPATATLANTRIDTINQAIEIKKACNCRVLVTATTGGTHESSAQSHGTGFKVDLEDTSDLNAFFQSNLRRDGSRGSDARYKDSCGNEYVYENAGQPGSHWDILVNQGVCKL